MPDRRTEQKSPQRIRADRNATTASSGSRKGLALAVIATSQLMVVLDVSIVNVALPTIQRSLHFSPSNLEWVVNAYALAFGGLLLLGGRIADIFGQRKTLIGGLTMLTLASLSGGLATGQAWLLAARAAQGLAGALVAPAALALLVTTFAEGAERNRAMGVYGATSGAGGALGNVLGGAFTDALSWRWVLFVNVPIAFLALLATLRAFRESATTRGRLDLPGALSVTAGISLVVCGLIDAASHSWGSNGTVIPLAGGGLLVLAFVIIEARTRSPLVPLRTFASRNRSAAYAVMLMFGAALIVVFYFLTLFMQIILGYNPLRTGLAFLAFAVGAGVTSGISGRFMGRTGARPLLGVGTLTSAGGLFWLSLLGANSGYLANLFGPLLLFGCGIGLCFVPLTLAAVAGVRLGEGGVPSALLNTSQQVGAALGLAVLGTVAAAVTRDRLHAASAAGRATALTHGYSVVFLVTGFVLLGAFLLSPLIRVRPASERDYFFAP